MRIGIVALVIAIAMLATVQSATAYDNGEPFAGKGWVHYENGTTCPYDWDLWMENLDWDMDGEPWHTTTSFCPPIYDYLKGGEYKSGNDYIQVTVTSPDGSYSGTNVRMWSDAYNGVNVMINITVSEVPQETETFTKPLVSGWNLVSLPLTPDDNSTPAVLASIEGNYTSVKSYNAATHQFEDATTMDPGIGYFIHMTATDTWSYEGIAYESMTASLSQGLNMVGWVNETGSALPDAFSSIDSNYRYVARWDASLQSYEVYLLGAPDVFNDFTTMERGEGYFIAAKTGCTLTYP